jgi:hypothetical protein
MRQRFNLHNQDRWRHRASAAVDLWLTSSASLCDRTGPLRVTDLGAGGQLVGRLLQERARYSVEYRPYDLLPQNSNVTQLDVRDRLPNESAEVTFCLGLLEYLPASDPISHRLFDHARYVIASYVGFDPSRIPLERRIELQWVRHQSDEDFCRCFQSAGFRLKSMVTVEPDTDDRYCLWMWEADRNGSRAPDPISG